jgi:hypothetical protein
LPATLVTVLVGCALAAGGYVYGKQSGAATAPASVPVHSVRPATGADPIVVPSGVDLPSR